MKITKLMMAHAKNIKGMKNISSELLNICRKCNHPQGYHHGDSLKCPPKGFKWYKLGSYNIEIYKRNTFVLHNEASEIFKLYLTLLGMRIKND